MKRYEQFPHTSDIGIRVYGGSLKELFENAAFAMFDTIADLEGLKDGEAVDIEVKAPTITGGVRPKQQLNDVLGQTPPVIEELLVAWLDELLYNFYTKGILFYEFKVESIAGGKVTAKACGRPIAKNRNRLKTEIKAITYSGLKIEKADDGYKVEIIFDV